MWFDIANVHTMPPNNIQYINWMCKEIWWPGQQIQLIVNSSAKYDREIAKKEHVAFNCKCCIMRLSLPSSFSINGSLMTIITHRS